MTMRARAADPLLPRGTNTDDDLRRTAWCALVGPVAAAVVIALVDPPLAVTSLLALAAGVASYWLVRRQVVLPLLATLSTSRAEHARTALDLASERADRDLRARVERALRHSDSEPASLRVGLRAVAEVVPDAEVTLLLNLPDEPRIGWRVPLESGELDNAEPVPGSPGCAALAQGTAVVATATSLDACAHLSELGADVAAACVPLRAAERTIGTVSVVTAPGEPLEDQTLDLVEWIVERTGHRTAEHRVARGPGSAGRPDPLTGLPTSAALRPHLREMVRSLSPFCLAMIEIDRFEQLDDDEEADAALVWVAQALCETLRPDDMIVRLDGGAFAAVLRQCSAEQAVSVMERLRDTLFLLLTEEGGGGHVSCSAGVVESHRATSLEEIVDLATTACDQARAAGGNRVAVAQPDLDRR